MLERPSQTDDIWRDRLIQSVSRDGPIAGAQLLQQMQSYELARAQTHAWLDLQHPDEDVGLVQERHDVEHP
jgi:hypothetical protein